MNRSLLPLFLLSLGLCAAPALAAPVAPAPTEAGQVALPLVEEAWVAEAPPTARHNAAYLRLRNGPRADVLLDVETPVAEVVELHAMTREQGVMRMTQEATVALAPGATLTLAPGGRHLMLINMKRALKPGERIPLTLRFRHAGLVTVEAEVRPLAIDAAPAPAAAHSPHAHHAH